MKKIAVVTMVRNDDFFLRKWVEYYGGQLGRENLYIYFDGKDQVPQPWCEGTNVVLWDKLPGQVAHMEQLRLGLLSDLAADLLENKGYEIIIGVDADEFVVVDPKLGISLGEYLSNVEIRGCLSPLGLDFGQKLGEEGDITDEIPFLQQRHYAQLGTRYTKTSIINKPLRWGAGFHRIKGHNFHIAKDLYMLHFGYFDLKRIEDRFRDKMRMEQGCEKHIRRRSKTIRLVTDLPARDFDRWTTFARRCQSVVRPPYAWNKPAMFELKIIVEIPDRFRDLV